MPKAAEVAQAVSDLLASQHPEWAAGSGKLDAFILSRYLAKNPTASIDAIAAMVWEQVQRHPQQNPIDSVWWTFGGGGHFGMAELSIALGMSEPDAPVEQKTPAYRAEDAVMLAKQGWYFTGDAKFLNVDDPARLAEFKRREKFAEILPPSWAGTDPILYWYLCVSGEIESGVPDFGTRPDNLWKSWKGFSFQQYMDNMWAAREKRVLPWTKGGLPA